MITSIFSKSKPTNYIIVAVFVITCFIYFNSVLSFWTFKEITYTLLRGLLAVFFVFLLDFIAVKNNISIKSNFVILSYALMLALSPKVFQNQDIILSNLFVMLAIRRLLSLHSNRSIQKKLFDAGFWITLATLFYFWSILFFILILVALLFYAKGTIKNVIIPFIGSSTVLVFLCVYNILMFNAFFQNSNFVTAISFEFSNYYSVHYLLGFCMLFLSVLLGVLFTLKSLSSKAKGLRPVFVLVLWYLVIAFVLALIAIQKNGSEFLFLLMPSAIVLSVFFESTTKSWAKELVAITCLLVALTMFFL